VEWSAEPNTLRVRLKAMPTANPLDTNGMRDCQIEAITSLEQSFAEDRPRALVHMARGAGKTFTACAFTYRLIICAKARRVLFLLSIEPDDFGYAPFSQLGKAHQLFGEALPALLEELNATQAA
jgi:hypothetical protein